VILLYRPAMAQLPTDKESGYPTDGLGIAIIAKYCCPMKLFKLK
jgi:replicative DNA helicase